MKQILFLMCLAVTLFAAQIEVSADKFSADEKKMASEFEGNVNIVKANDTLTADKVLINFDTKRQPVLYTATGNVKINMLFDGKYYNASGEKITYDPFVDRYTLEGKAFLSEVDTDKKVYGEMIEIDRKNSNYSVFGSNNSVPAKFIFQIEDAK